MKSRIIPAIVLPLLAFGCAAQTNNDVAQQQVARERVVHNLNPITKVEERVRKLTQVMQHLPLVANVNAEDAQKLKEHYDVYYIYHNAATVSLAQGDLRAYKNHLQVASRELDSLEAKLKHVVSKESPEMRNRNY
ncbi:MAG: hypothetical protein ACREQ7_16295 [Candidatus Binatia bacterium]